MIPTNLNTGVKKMFLLGIAGAVIGAGVCSLIYFKKEVDKMLDDLTKD